MWQKLGLLAALCACGVAPPVLQAADEGDATTAVRGAPVVQRLGSRRPAVGRPAVRPVPRPGPRPGVGVGLLPGRRPGRAAKKPSLFEACQQAELVFTATLRGVAPGPVALSNPPIYHHTLDLEVKDVFRGGLEPGGRLAAHHSARQQRRPTFPLGKLCIVVAEKDPRSQRIRALRVERAAEKLLADAKLAASLPVGWSMKDGKAVSPWAGMGEKAWPKDARPKKDQVACSKTGRPALLAGEGIRMEVAPVPPPKKIKWTNPDGDGLYKITVTNTSKELRDVPALLTDGEKVLWNESLVIVCQGKARPAPLCRPLKARPKPTILEPGRSVSGVVNAFLLKDIRWPRGGYRISFRFCLGELSSTQSFYYLSRHHDKVRKAAAAAAK